MKGITRQEIIELNSINMIDFFKATMPNEFTQRKDGTLASIEKDGLVIYSDHSFCYNMIASEKSKPYKDLIGTLRYINPQLSFMESVDYIRNYIRSSDLVDDNGNASVPHYNLFD